MVNKYTIAVTEWGQHPRIAQPDSRCACFDIGPRV